MNAHHWVERHDMFIVDEPLQAQITKQHNYCNQGHCQCAFENEISHSLSPSQVQIGNRSRLGGPYS